MLTTILFDLDGTLCPFLQDEFIQAYFKALVARLAPMGYNGEKLVAALWKGTGAMLKNDGTYTNRQVFWECFTKELGMAALALESILDDFYTREFNGVRAVLKEERDCGGMIRSLREKGYGLILATNPVFPAVAVETRMNWVGLRPQDFDFITTYENSRYSKPNPDYYRAILAAAGKEPGECLMIGNNPVDDMAALKAGLSCRLVTDYLENPEDLPIGDYVHSSFRELEEYLGGLPPVQRA